MREGKLTNEQLKSIIFSRLKPRRGDILMRSGVGIDAAALEIGDEACVLTTDPITAADAWAGSLAIHICCNDLAACGAKPAMALVTLLAPPECSITDIERTVSDMADAAETLGIEVAGGHTEVTNAVRRLVISTTAVGTVSKGKLIFPGGAKEGDSLVMSKWAGLEGTTIITSDHADKIEGVLTADETAEAAGLKKHISVVPEGLIGAEVNVHAMHDITEGGVLGAAWEMAEAAGLGIEIYEDDIPVLPVTSKLCKHLRLDAKKLISSGCMLFAHPDGDQLVAGLRESGIPAKAIGRFTGEGRVLVTGGNRTAIEPPEADEIYKL